jgi:hypothetical protein
LQETQERPPLDFFSAIFDNQDSDEDNIEEQETEETKNDVITKPIITQSSITLGSSLKIPSVLLKAQQSRDSDHSDSSDSSIEEIEVLGSNKSALAYGPAIPANLSSRPKTDNISSNVFILVNSLIIFFFLFSME